MRTSVKLILVITLVSTLLSFMALMLIKLSIAVYFAFAGCFVSVGLLVIELRKIQKKYKEFSSGIAAILRQTACAHDVSDNDSEKALLDSLHSILEDLRVNLHDSEQYREMAQDLRSNHTLFMQTLDTLCPVHLPPEVGQKWNTLIEKEWNIISAETLESLNKIKIMNEQNQEFIQNVVKEFGVQQDNFAEFSRMYSSNIADYARKAGIIRTSFMQSIESSSSRIEETFASFGKVVEIIERIKMISLNMSIEASKVRGSEAFYFLARELRKLATDTEETLSGITMIIQTTLETMHASSDKQTKEFMTMDEVVQQFEKTLDEYKDTSSKLAEFIQKAINQIDKNQESQRLILLEFFKNLQRIAIVKEEFEHRIQFETSMLEKVNAVIYTLVRKYKTCAGTNCPYRREALEALAKIANTDAERQFVNELFKEYLNEDREQEHGTIGGDGFIQF